MIVVDDGSSDESPEIIREYGNRITPMLKPNGGQASAWNDGVRRARGEWIWFLDSDDVVAPDAVTLLLAELAKHPGSAKAHWQMRAIDASGEPVGRMIRGEVPSAGESARGLAPRRT